MWNKITPRDKPCTESDEEKRSRNSKLYAMMIIAEVDKLEKMLKHPHELDDPIKAIRTLKDTAYESFCALSGGNYKLPNE